jgi:hypothetical protein
MSSVGPVPPASSGNAATATTPSTATSGTTNLPAGLANLQAGAILTGNVIGRDTSGHTLIRTANGVVSLSTALSLPPGSTISLQVQTTGVQIQVVVLSINQQPPPGPGPVFALLQSAGPDQAARAGAAAPPPLGADPAVTVETGALVTATLATVFRRSLVAPTAGSGPESALAAAKAGAPQAGAPTAAPAGAEPGAQAALQRAAQAGALAEAQAGVQRAVQAGGKAIAALAAEIQPQQAAVPGPSSGRATAPPSLFDLPAGTRFQVRLAAFEADPTRDPLTVLRAAATARGDVPLLLGKVLGPGPAGEMQVRTAFGVFTLAIKAPLAPSGHVVLELVGAPLPPLPDEAPSAALARAEVHLLSRDWPALTQAFAALDQADPLRAQHLIQTLLPRAGPALAINALFLIAALRNGDVRGWLGETAHALDEIGRGDLVTRLGHDFALMARFAAQPSGTDWRAVLIPLFDGANVQFVRLYTKRNRKRPGTGPQSEATRFLLDLELSRLGAMQLDGLLRPQRLDMIIRTHEPLSADMRIDLSGIFSDSLEAAGYAGGLSFQATPTFASAAVGDPGAERVGLSV